MLIIRNLVMGLYIGILPSAAQAQGFSNWSQFANWCRSTGGSPIPNPPRCLPRQTSPSPSAPQPSVPQPGPHVSRSENGQWTKDAGYDWLTAEEDDLRVKWVPGTYNPEHPNVVASNREGKWDPKPGYAWVDRSDNDDWNVKWVANKHFDSHPNIVTSEREGYWKADRGYEFIHPHSHDLGVVESGEIDARFANLLDRGLAVTALEEQKRRLEELSGLDQYDRVAAALKILASRWAIMMPLAASDAQREVMLQRAQQELKGLMKQVLQAAVDQMVKDIRSLLPFVWNPFGSQKRQMLEQVERDVLARGMKADHEIANDRFLFLQYRSGSDRSGLEYRPAFSLDQLQKINSERRWAD